MSQDKTKDWNRPNDVMVRRGLKNKGKSSQDCLKQCSSKTSFNFSSTTGTEPIRKKRKNQFEKENTQVDKKPKTESTVLVESYPDSALFNLISSELTEKPAFRIQEAIVKQRTEFVDNYVQPTMKEEDAVEKTNITKPNPPIDWSLKLKVRLISKISLPSHPKASQEASGITSFVRCLHSLSDLPTDQGGGLDTSLGSRLQQSSLYWIHPSIPGEKLFPRKVRTSSVAAGLPKEAMFSEWSDSFRSLFQLLRAKQCPFFYLCANAFTALFRAGGIGGLSEPHAIISPTTQGFRQTLKQEDIEFKMPLRKSECNFNDSGDKELLTKMKDDSNTLNSEASIPEEDEDDEISHEQWLESLGVDEVEIKRINYSQARKDHATECRTDSSDISLVLIQGPDLQSLYNFLLNSKSTVGGVGVLPPTLLAPTAFVGATLKFLQYRFNRIKQNGVDYNSVELRGPILPNVVRNICDNLAATTDNFSISMTTLTDTRALSKAAKVMISDLSGGGEVFGRENLSSCGLSRNMLNDICSSSSDYITNTEHIIYQENVGYTWN